MTRPGGSSVDAVLASLLDACEAAAEIVAYGKESWNAERRNRLAGEAIVGRIGDSAAKLPLEVRSAVEQPWDDIIGLRIVVDHVYHRVDYEELWNTLSRDVPELAGALTQWQATDAERREATGERPG